MEWLQIGGGLAVLLLAGEWLVKGAVNLSLRLGIPAIVVSLTIVAFGTSAPELLIVVQAVLAGAPGLAVGNVLGSNIANILLILGLPALISALHTSHFDTRRNYLFMLLATVVLMVECFLSPITWFAGLLMLLILTGIIVSFYREAQTTRPAAAELHGLNPSMRGRWIALYLVAGLIGLPIGAHFLVEGAVTVARSFGVSEAVIGLTLVAVGTSLPELATTVVAAIRKNADVALGNVIGSNMFNALAIIGTASLIAPVPVDPAFLGFDVWVMLASAIALAPFVFLRRDITRAVGAVFVALYALYVAALLA